MDIIEIYKSMLKFSGLEADKDGFISSTTAGHNRPIIVNDLRLVLPTYDNLRGFNPKEHAIFHPLAENIVRNESVVLKKYRDIINIRLNYTIATVVQGLLNVVASPELHKQLNPEQTHLLTCIKDCDDKAVLNFTQQMVSHIKHAPDAAFINIFLKRGGFKGKQKFARLAVISFPFYTNIDELKVRQKDKATFKQVFKYLFPDIAEPEAYNYGSDGHIAPFLDALMHGAAMIASQLNDALELFKDYIEDADKLIFDSEWLEYFDNLEQLTPEIRKIPTHIIDDYVQPSAPEPAPAPAYMPQPQPTYMPQPQPGYIPQPQPGYMPQPQPPVEVQKTSRGLDFHSLVQNNPQIGMIPNPIIQAYGYQTPPMQPQGYYQPPQGYQPPQAYQPQQPPQGYYPPQPGYYPQPGYQEPMMQPGDWPKVGI